MFTVNTGQDCTAATRVYVEQSRVKQATEAIVESMRAIKIGLPYDDAVQMGPLISGVQRERVKHHAGEQVGGHHGDDAVGLLLGLVNVSGATQELDLPAWTGGPTQPLALTDLEGRPRDLAEYRGKVLVVNFWATWCPPCREELPSLERLRDALQGRPFEVLAVNVAEGEPRVKGFLAEVPLRLPVLLDRDGGAQRAWKVRGLPATFLLDTEGAIRFWYLGELDWAQPNILRTVESLLGPTR